jgi:phosphoglycolate phosphatase
MLVAFDLDGTLVDSSGDLAASGNALLASYGAAPLSRDAVVAMVGDGARELVRRLLTATALDVPLDDALDRFLSVYNERLLATTVPYDGIPALLQELRPTTRLAVLTNKPVSPSERILRGLGLREYFDDVIGGDSDFGRKPKPDGLLALVDRAGVSTARTLMVGDSVTDLRTARHAKVPACVVRYGFGFLQMSSDDAASATFVVDSPGEIAGVVARLRAS